ncbi:MAG: hypothetical protein GY862_10275 [Gammaproteobacteria bacterium]|nr:hypothetical protein [Gammaproteobacteria bacterium]
MYDKYKDYDFADAKPVAQTPVLAKLQADGKSRITVQMDNEIPAFFKVRAEREHNNYTRRKSKQ